MQGGLGILPDEVWGKADFIVEDREELVGAVGTLGAKVVVVVDVSGSTKLIDHIFNPNNLASLFETTDVVFARSGLAGDCFVSHFSSPRELCDFGCEGEPAWLRGVDVFSGNARDAPGAGALLLLPWGTASRPVLIASAGEEVCDGRGSVCSVNGEAEAVTVTVTVEGRGSCVARGCELYYSLDGTTPDPDLSPQFRHSLILTSSAVVTVAAYSPGPNSSLCCGIASTNILFVPPERNFPLLEQNQKRPKRISLDTVQALDATVFRHYNSYFLWPYADQGLAGAILFDPCRSLCPRNESRPQSRSSIRRGQAAVGSTGVRVRCRGARPVEVAV